MIIAIAVLGIAGLFAIVASHRSALRCGAYAIIHGPHTRQTRSEGWNSVLLLAMGIALFALAGFGFGVS